MLSRFSIRLNIFFSFLFLVAAISTVFTVFEYLHITKAVSREVNKHGIDVIKTFGQLVAPHIFESDYVTVLDISNQIVEGSDIEFISIINTSGEVWLSTTDTVDKYQLPEKLQEISSDKNGSTHKIVSRKKKDSVEFIYPIYAIGKIEYFIISEISLEDISKTYPRRFKEVAVSVVCMMLLSSLLAYSIAKSLSQPIQNLVIGTEELAHGNFSHRIDIDSSDEIGRLSATFNSMAENLEKESSIRKRAETKLKEHRDDLGILVEKRTAELLKSEARLKTSEAKFRGLVESSNDLIWEVDREGIYTYISPQAVKILGYEPEDIVGKMIVDFIVPGDRDEIFLSFKKSVEKAVPIVAKGHTNLHKSGHQIILETSGSPFFNENGEVAGYRGIDRDITERHLAERDKKKLEEQLYQAQKMESIGRLAGGIAHDFNNILSAINGYAELCLIQMGEDQPLRKHIGVILESGQRAARLTEQLLAFGRRQIIRHELIDLNKEIVDTRKMLDRILGENIEIEIFQANDLWPVKAAHSQMEQVVMNLAVNARDAMPLGGHLTLETANVILDESYQKEHFDITPGNYVMLAISDNGVGIDEATKEHIFEPFYSTKKEGKGTGLGLATVYGIVKQNKGEIHVYSEPGKGSMFKIYLPRAEEYLDKEEGSAEREDINDNRGTEVILLVEDDQLVRNMCTVILSDLGYTLLEAENGEDALQVCSRFHGDIDLLLTDVVMPKMSGPDLAAKMQDLRPDIKVLFMSGYTENAIVKHGVLAEDINFIHKPITPKSLSRTVREVLG